MLNYFGPNQCQGSGSEDAAKLKNWRILFLLFYFYIDKNGKLCRQIACRLPEPNPRPILLSMYRLIKAVSKGEIYILHLIYLDLAERIEDSKINLENFLLFFHKNGYWGERLFQEFDYDETNLLSEPEFIHGICTSYSIQPKSLSPPKKKKSTCSSNSSHKAMTKTEESPFTIFSPWYNSFYLSSIIIQKKISIRSSTTKSLSSRSCRHI